MLRGALTSVYKVRSGTDVLVCTGAAAGKRLVEGLRHPTTSGGLSVAYFLSLSTAGVNNFHLSAFTAGDISEKKFRWANGGEISKTFGNARQWVEMKHRTLCQRSS